jgi:AraC-like DNA-binding protein
METIAIANGKNHELGMRSSNIQQQKETLYFSLYKTIRECLFIHLFICLKKYKLEQAAFRLLTTHESLDKIAERAGYRNTDKFIKHFSAHFVIAPKDFAEKYRATIL